MLGGYGPKSFTAFVLACAVFVASPATAATPQEQALAEGLFREGKALVDSGQLATGCEKFAESFRLDEKLGTLLHLATCHELLGRFASAWAEYGQAAALAARAREPQRQKLALERVRALEPQLARVRIVLAEPSPEGAELRLDGRKLGLPSVNVALPVDPGAHVVEMTAPGRKPWRFEVKPTAGATTDVSVPVLEAHVEPVAAPTPSPSKSVAPTATPEPAATLEDGPSVAPVTWVLGGVAIVGLGVGAGFGAIFLSQRSEGLEACDETSCTARGLERLDDARTSSLVSGVGFGVGLAAAAAAVVVHIAKVGRGGAAVGVAATPRGVALGGAW